jgi:tetratricopeptide (TPR) repeat protein
MMNVDMEKIVAPSPVFPSQASVLISSRNAPDGDLIGTPMDGELFEERGPSLIPSLQALKNEPPAPEESQKAPKFTFANGDFAIESKSYMENSPSIHNIQNKRYKQMQELELSGRLDDLRFKYGENHPATIDTAIRLSGVLSDQGRYRSAELLLKQCEECLQQSVGENNKITLVTSSKLAHCFVQQGQLSKAEKLFTEVYLRASQFSTPSDPMFLVMKMDFANCIALLGNSAGAEQELREVLNVGRGFLPVDDHILLTCMRYLAEVLKLRSKFCEAEKILLDLMQAEARGETADCLRTRALLGDVYRLQGKFQQAERTLREVQEAQQQLLGSEHDQTLITERTLVLILRDLRRFDESEKLLRESIERSIKVLGIKHRLVSNKIRHLACPSSVELSFQDKIPSS